MRRIWREQHWRAPRLQEDVEHNETHLMLPLESLLPEEAVNALWERWGKLFRQQDELGRIILVTAEAEASIGHARVRELSDVHSRDITLKFQELVRNGMLRSRGGGRSTTYTPRTPDPGPLFARISDTPPTSEATPVAGDATPAPCDATSPASHATAARNAATPEPDDATPYAAVARVWQDARVPPNVLDEAIVAVCTGEYLTREEIAEKVNRAVNSLRARSLPRLVKEGRLQLKYPERPNHPHQAYGAAGSRDTEE
jgi:ATP-dependent DNA helicase RecG